MDILLNVGELNDCKVLPSGVTWTDGRHNHVELAADQDELRQWIMELLEASDELTHTTLCWIANQYNMEVSFRDPGPDLPRNMKEVAYVQSGEQAFDLSPTYRALKEIVERDAKS